MINIHNYIYHLYSIDVKNSRYMYMNFCIQHTFYIFYNLHLFYTFYTDLHQLPSNPIHGSSWRSRPLLWSWRRVVNPKCHSWRMLRRPCLWRSPSKRKAATVGGWGYRGGMGEEAPWFGKMKVIGYWNCRMGCFFFGLIGLIGVFLFLLKWDSCSLWLWRKYKILGVLIEWWVRKATDEVFIAELPSLKLAVGGVNGDFELWVTFLLYTFLIFFLSCFWVSLSIMDKPKWMIQKLWISNNQNFAVALVP